MFSFIKTLWVEVKSWFKPKISNVSKCPIKNLDNLNDTVWEVDTQLNITYINKSIERYGWSVKELINKSISMICPPETIQLCLNAIIKYQKNPAKYSNQRFRVLCNYKDSDKTYNVEINVSVLKDDDGVVIGYSGVSRNIDDQLKIEALEKQNSIFKSIFTFCTGVCNELSQPLQAILGYLGIIKLLDLTKEEDQKEVMRLVNLMIKQIDRIVDLIKTIQKVKSNGLGDVFIDKILKDHKRHP